ncbi:hypothetical protein ACLB1M_04695 [Escherichia coli]
MRWGLWDPCCELLATASNKVAATTQAQWPVHAVITNSTYDGLLYNTDWISRRWMSLIDLDLPGARTPIFIRSTRVKVVCSGERVAGKVILRNAIDPQNAGGDDRRLR